MPENEFVDLIIIGGGPGGLTAGIYAMRAALKTVLLEKGVPGGQVTMSDEVENYPGFETVSGYELSQKFLQHAEGYGLDIRNQEVTFVEPGLDHHTVHLDDGTRIAAHAVIIATGGYPRKMGIPGEDEYYGKGVSYCAVCDGFFFRNKTVVVVGGGDTAAEEALYLAKLARKVYLVHRRDSLRAGMILQKRVLSECKIEIIWDTVVTGIHAGEDGVESVGLRNVKTDQTMELAADGVFIFIGFLPNNQIVPAGTKMNSDGYVQTDEKCETNNPGIYVIGDLREKYARQIVVSASDGCIAALAAAHFVETKKADTGVCEAPADLLKTSP